MSLSLKILFWSTWCLFLIGGYLIQCLAFSVKSLSVTLKVGPPQVKPVNIIFLEFQSRTRSFTCRWFEGPLLFSCHNELKCSLALIELRPCLPSPVIKAASSCFESTRFKCCFNVAILVIYSFWFSLTPDFHFYYLPHSIPNFRFDWIQFSSLFNFTYLQVSIMLPKCSKPWACPAAASSGNDYLKIHKTQSISDCGIELNGIVRKWHG